MFEPYTPLDRCIGKSIRVRMNGDEFEGLLIGVYSLGQVPMLVITPLRGGGEELHIPVPSAVVAIKS
ncbi:MAG: hypothetical protein ACM3XM_02240 [Mycobacterium leprae]